MRLIDADALIQKESVMRKGCAYIEEINNAPTIDADRWIPCSERLPNEGQSCLVCDKGRIFLDTFVGHGIPYNWRWYVGDYEAWIPLPKPYRDESEVEE